MRLCFYVIPSFLPSLPAGCRHADHGVKLLTAGLKAGTRVDRYEALNDLCTSDRHIPARGRGKMGMIVDSRKGVNESTIK